MREAHLTEIEDVYGNRIKVTYATETRSWNNGCGNAGDYIKAIRPTEINYYPASSGVVSTVKITFRYHNTVRTDDGSEVMNGLTPEIQTFWSEYNLWGIDVQINDGGWQSSRHYKLVQETTSGGESLLVLRYIEDYGANGSSGIHLPSYEFTYSRYDNRWKNTTLLQRAKNGYGGIVKYSYALFTNIDIRGCRANGGLVEAWLKADRYYVQFMDIGDGMTASYGTPTTNTIQLAPSNPFAHGENPGAGCPTDFQFGGYGQVQRDVKRGTSTYSRTITKYHTGAGDEVSSAAGLVSEQKRLDPNNNNYDLGKVEAFYMIGSAYHAEWVYKQWERETITGTNAIVMRHQTNYDYQMSHQKNQQLGRVTHATEYLNETPIRTQVFSFTRSYTDMPFVVRLAQQQLFAGTGGGICQGETRYFYDGNNTLGDLLIRGELDKTSVSTQNVTGINDCDRNTATMYTLFDYDNYGRQTQLTDARGGVTNISYDNVLHVYPRFIDKPDVNGYRPTVEYIWDYTIGQVRFEKDVDNNVQTEYRYDRWGRAENIFPPLGGWTQIDYFDDTGQAIVLPYRVQTRTDTSTTPHQIYQITYIDGLGREIETKSTYVNPSNTVEHVVGHTFYHPLGGVATTYAPKAFSSTSGGTHGYILPSEWGTPYISTVAYDALGRPVTETAPDGTTTTHTYNISSTVKLNSVVMSTHHINIANQNRSLSYTDALGRLRGVEERNATDGVYAFTRYDYDIADRLTNVYDHFNNHTEVEYDLAGRKTRMDDPDMGEWFYRYDRMGVLKAQVDAASNGTCFNYDALGRPVAKIVYDNATIGTIFNSGNPCPLTGVTITENVTNLYDSGSYGKGRLYSVTDLSGDATTYIYDGRGRVTNEVETIRYLNTNYVFKTSFEYDILDRVRKITYPADTSGNNTNGEQVHYDYDTQRQLNLTGVRLVANGITTNLASNMTYNQYGQMNTMMYGTVPALQQKYDYHPMNGTNGESLGRVNHMYLGELDTNGVNTANVWRLNYTYDTVGNVERIGSHRNLSEFQYQHFSYDFLNRLTHAYTEFSSANGGYDEYYGYNQIGNMTGKAGVGYIYPTSGNARPHAVSSLSNGKSYTYDAVGNMETRSTGSTVDNTFLYDNENRLTRIVTGDYTSLDVVSDYGYNGQGERVFANINGERILSPNQYVEFKLNEVGPTGQFTRYYYMGTQRIAMKRGGALNYFINDHLGSTSLVFNTNTTLHSEQRYKPYGETRWSSAPLPTRHQFTGQINDIGTGLYFYNARYYDPALGRFTQADTIVPTLGNPQTLNRFSYVTNNPIKYNDPTGHEPEEPADDSGLPPCQNYECWVERWYNAHGYFLDPVTRSWTIQGTAVFRDKGILLEVLGNVGVEVVGDWSFTELYYIGVETAALLQKTGSNILESYPRLRQILGNSDIKLVRGSVYYDEAKGAFDPGVGAAVTNFGDHYQLAVYDAYYTRAEQGNLGYIVHEYGHIIDSEATSGFGIFSPSAQFPSSNPVSWYGSTSRRENWADAVALYVYPNYFMLHIRPLEDFETQYIEDILR